MAGLAEPARADAFKVTFLTKVAEGQRPRVRVQAVEPIERLEINLSRDDGPNVSAAWDGLTPGAQRELVLPGDPGKHRYEGRIAITQKGTTRHDSLAFETVVAAAMRVTVDKSRVDLKARQLELSMSRPAGRIEVKVYGPTGGAPVAETQHDLTGRAAGEPLVVTWPAPADGSEAARIDLRAYDADGFFVGVTLVPWSVHIPHEEVSFATDAATIAPAEAPKLNGSYQRIAQALAAHRELGPIKLFIAGHTDTVGKASYNVKLSQRRAQAIAAWFRKRGLRIPIAYEGFGEHALLVATADETDEPRNRRVDYILAVEDPWLTVTGSRPTWRPVP